MKKNIILIIAVVSLLFLTLAVYYVYNHKIINDNYNQLTISKMNQTLMVIQDSKEINAVIDRINSSPKKFQFQPKTGFEYDYLPHGFLTLENDSEKIIFDIVFIENDQVTILTDYWEIKTDLKIGNLLE